MKPRQFSQPAIYLCCHLESMLLSPLKASHINVFCSLAWKVSKFDVFKQKRGTISRAIRHCTSQAPPCAFPSFWVLGLLKAGYFGAYEAQTTENFTVHTDSESVGGRDTALEGKTTDVLSLLSQANIINSKQTPRR